MIVSKNDKLISIIINCYNGDKYLDETILSVLGQTYCNWELIFWDNQSNDSSKDIFNKYHDERLQYYYSEEHTSLSKARNLALSKITGNYFCFLDSDDVWNPLKLEKQIEEFERFTDLGFTYSRFDILTTGLIQNNVQFDYYNSINCVPHEKQNLYKRLLLGNYIIFSSILFRKIDNINNIKINESLNQNEDYDFLLKYSLLYDATCIDCITTKYRIHNSNNSLKNLKLNFVENALIFKSLPQSKEVIFSIKKNKFAENYFQLKHEGNINAFFKIFNLHSLLIIVKFLLKKLHN